MVGHRRLGDVERDRAAGARERVVRQLAHDVKPLRVAERMEHGRELDLLALRMVKGLPVIHRDFDYTAIIELLVRCPSYYRRCPPMDRLFV